MLDGIPINDPFFGYVQWNRVPMENIERVEVVRGAGASLWGNYAMGGVINIVTRKPSTSVKASVGASGGGGSYGTYRGDGFADVVLSDSVSMRANFDAWGTAGFNQIQPAYGPIYVPTSFNALNGQASVYINPDPSLTANLRVNVHSNNQVLMIPVQTNNQQIYDLAGSLTKKFGDYDLTVTAFHEQSRFLTNNAATPFGFQTGQAAYLQEPAHHAGLQYRWLAPAYDPRQRRDSADQRRRRLPVDLGHGLRPYLQPGGRPHTAVFRRWKAAVHRGLRPGRRLPGQGLPRSS